MTALAEKLEKAGVDTLGAKLTTACIEGLRLWPNNPRLAWDHAFNAFGRHFVMGIMADMATAASPAAELSRNAQAQPLAMPPRELLAPKPYTPRVIPPERLEKRRELREIVRSKYKNSGGVAWSEVGWHELHGLKRDGAEAKALLDAGPANAPNNGTTVGEVLGVQRVDEIIKSVRQ